MAQQQGRILKGVLMADSGALSSTRALRAGNTISGLRGFFGRTFLMRFRKLLTGQVIKAMAVLSALLVVIMIVAPVMAQTASAPTTTTVGGESVFVGPSPGPADNNPIVDPTWLNNGDNAWQMIAATIVGIQSIPGLAILYGGVVKKKWAINSAFMVFYAFSSVLIAWLLWAYNMGFGPQWLAVAGQGFVGQPISAAAMHSELTQACLPGAGHYADGSGFSYAAFPMASMVFFQFVFAAITVILIAGSLFGRMSFVAWMLFCPLWLTLSYTVGAFSLWGGGWLAQMGCIDYSGGYVIHLAAGVSAFVAAAILGPRLPADRSNFKPNNILMVLAGAGLLWLGWDGFNGGDPYTASPDAGAAVLNTNVATAAALLTWMFLDYFRYGKPSVLGAVNGMIAGLVGITPGAGVVNGYGALAVGLVGAIVPWTTMNILGKKLSIFTKVDDCLGVIHTHGFAGLTGGLLTGILATPLGCAAFNLVAEPGATNGNIGGALYGNPHQLLLQVYGAGFIIGWNLIITTVIMFGIKLFVPLRMSEEKLRLGDLAVHGEEAYGLADQDSSGPITV
ncbi:MAG TPA: ammonium transporter [Phycisphaerae bacterium]|nr:ammonium transporter [Phycisphaerae bacterium]